MAVLSDPRLKSRQPIHYLSSSHNFVWMDQKCSVNDTTLTKSSTNKQKASNECCQDYHVDNILSNKVSDVFFSVFTSNCGKRVSKRFWGVTERQVCRAEFSAKSMCLVCVHEVLGSMPSTQRKASLKWGYYFNNQEKYLSGPICTFIQSPKRLVLTSRDLSFFTPVGDC